MNCAKCRQVIDRDSYVRQLPDVFHKECFFACDLCHEPIYELQPANVTVQNGDYTFSHWPDCYFKIRGH